MFSVYSFFTNFLCLLKRSYNNINSLSDDDKKNKTEINENKFRKNKNKQNNTDTLLKKYLIEEKFDVGEKRARKQKWKQKRKLNYKS
jgi:hypothetical protein